METVEECEVVWHASVAEGVRCTVKTPWGDVDITESQEFLKDDWVWRVMFFSDTGVVCEVEESGTGLSLSPTVVAIHLIATNQGFM